jgi:hypothetical protein
VVHRYSERLSLVLSMTGAEAPRRNARGEVAEPDRHYINGVQPGGPDDYPIGHDLADCERLAALVASGAFAEWAHGHLLVLERGTTAVTRTGQAVLL